MLEEYQPQPLTEYDYIFSMLVDNPDIFYLTPGRQLAFVYLPSRGMFMIRHDFSCMSNPEVDTFLFHLKRGLP